MIIRQIDYLCTSGASTCLYISRNIPNIHIIKIIITITLHIGRANTGISHDRTSTTRLYFCCTTSTSARGITLYVITTKLMPHFVSYIINIKGIPCWVGATGITTSFTTRSTDTTNATGISTTGGIEVVPNVIISISDDIVDGCLRCIIPFIRPRVR